MKKVTKPLSFEPASNVYQTIITLAVLLHASHALLFFLLNCPLPALYNTVSVTFYCIMLAVVRYKMFRVAVVCIHLEVCLFAVICVTAVGWQSGCELYLLAISSLVYFCPFQRKFVPYLFSTSEVLLFITLKITSTHAEPYYSHITNTPMTWFYLFNAITSGCIMLLAAFISNITASVTNARLLDENRNLERMANYDLLTGLNSRRHFLSLLQDYPPNSPIVVAIGDIDDFKFINDTYGHHMGDLVLHAVAQRLILHCSEQTIVCRWGGEEFAFIVIESKASTAAAQFEAMRNAIDSRPFITEDAELHVTMTFGLSHGDTKEKFEDLIAHADSQLYLGKENGKNKVVFDDVPKPLHTP